MIFVKICGITTPAAIDAAAVAGVDAVGFVFAPSPRQVSARDARALAAGLPRQVQRIAVFRHPDAKQVAEVLELLEPDAVQTDAGDFATLELPSGCLALPVYRSGTAPAGGELPPRLLFEGPLSGSGQTADWHEARALARRTQLVLAGGLAPSNVGDAIRAVQPWGVDVSSGVEHARGQKDADKIAQFVARARAVAMEDTPTSRPSDGSARHGRARR